MKAELQNALNNVTIPLLNGLGYGCEVELNDTYTLYRYVEDDCVSVVETEEWNEVLAVTWDDLNIEYDVIDSTLVYG